MPVPSLLHSAHTVTWGAWHFEPTVIGAALIVCGAYAYALSVGAARPDWRRVAFFAAGATSMVVALLSPLDAAAHRLLSLHMLQHVVLTTIGPPLVLLGLPQGALRHLTAIKPVDAALAFVTTPLVAAALFILNMWIWHVPPVYESALNTLGVHIGMHIAFMATGLIFWWPIVQPLPERARIGDGGRLLYLFVTGFPMAVLALLLVASGSPVYSYYESAPRLWGVSALADQQVAGVIMGSLGESASFIAMTLLFFRFLDKEERAADAALSPGPIDAA